MDWDNQPDPFLTYKGAPKRPFLKVPIDEPAAPLPLDSRGLSRLFFDSLALSAWKSYQGKAWPLRVNPSSGNLHPTEGYLISGPVPGLLEQASVCHYAPLEHALEIRAEIPPELWQKISSSTPAGSVFVGLSSIHWREAWKYGERAFRYCQHDVGHAIEAIGTSARALGWRAKLVDGLSTADLAAVLGLSGPRTDEESEEPECLLLIAPGEAADSGEVFNPEIVTAFQKLAWSGVPSPLSPAHESWPAIDDVALATRKERTPELTAGGLAGESYPRKIIHQRRSAVDFDGTTSIAQDSFYRILSRAQGHSEVISWKPEVHLAIFVHRVTDLDPGSIF